MSALLIILSAAMALLTFLFVIFLLTFIKRRQSVDIFHRLRRHYDREDGRVFRAEDFLRRGYKFVKRAAAPLAALNLVKRMEFKLKQAGVPLTGGEFIIIAAVLATVSVVFVYMVSLNVNFSAGTFFEIPLFAWLWVRFRIDRRKKAFTEQLGDCLTTVANALRAGYSFQQAMAGAQR